jgi:hypothetical protein
MVPKLSGACYAVRSLFHVSNINTLQVNLFRIFSVCCKVQDNFLGKFFQQQEDIYFTKENH